MLRLSFGNGCRCSTFGITFTGWPHRWSDVFSRDGACELLLRQCGVAVFPLDVSGIEERDAVGGVCNENSLEVTFGGGKIAAQQCNFAEPNERPRLLQVDFV